MCRLSNWRVTLGNSQPPQQNKKKKRPKSPARCCPLYYVPLSVPQGPIRCCVYPGLAAYVERDSLGFDVFSRASGHAAQREHSCTDTSASTGTSTTGRGGKGGSVKRDRPIIAYIRIHAYWYLEHVGRSHATQRTYIHTRAQAPHAHELSDLARSRDDPARVAHCRSSRGANGLGSLRKGSCPPETITPPLRHGR